jgi:chromosome segregation ATPase
MSDKQTGMEEPPKDWVEKFHVICDACGRMFEYERFNGHASRLTAELSQLQTEFDRLTTKFEERHTELSKWKDEYGWMKLFYQAKDEELSEVNGCLSQAQAEKGQLLDAFYRERDQLRAANETLKKVKAWRRFWKNDISEASILRLDVILRKAILTGEGEGGETDSISKDDGTENDQGPNHA